MSNHHTSFAVIPRSLTAIFRIISWRIFLNRFGFPLMAVILLQQFRASNHAVHYHSMQSVHMRERVAATYPWDMSPQHFHVFKCCDFVPATCISVYATQIFLYYTLNYDVVSLFSLHQQNLTASVLHVFYLYSN